MDTPSCFGTFLALTLPGCKNCEHVLNCKPPADLGQRVMSFELLVDGLAYGLPRYEPPAPFSILEPDLFKDPKPTTQEPFARPQPARSSGIMPPMLVSRNDVFAAGQFQRRAQNVPWPDNFYMEGGRDRRHLDLENRNLRHQIDWFRIGSEVEPMPNIEHARDYGSPYVSATGTMANIAKITWVEFRDIRRGSFNDVADRIIARIRAMGIRTAATHRNAIRDTLRDCALFGLLRRHGSGSHMVFELA